MRRAFTLIELLIVVAIIAILSSGAVFSFTQIVTRSVMAERRFRLDQDLATFAEALAGDVAQAASHETRGAASLRLALAPEPGGLPRAIEYRIEPGRLVRTLETGGERAERVLLAEEVTGEITADPDGVSLALTGRFTMGWRTVERRTSLFAAWPGALDGGHP